MTGVNSNYNGRNVQLERKLLPRTQLWLYLLNREFVGDKMETHYKLIRF